jgi:hypothetical protein
LCRAYSSITCTSTQRSDIGPRQAGQIGDAEEGPPADPAEVITAQAQADGAEHAALMARLIAAGLDGYAHRRGAPPVPGVFSGPAAVFGQGMCLDAAVPCSTLSAMADDASGEDRTFAGAGAVPGEVPAGFAARTNLTLPLATLLDLAERPGMMPGVGAIDPLLVRDLAAAASRNPRSTWCLTITDPDGRPVAHGCGRRPPRSRDKRERPGHLPRAGPVFTSADHGPPGTGTLRLNLAAFSRTTDARTTGVRTGDDGADPGRELEFILEPLAGPCDHRHQAAGHDPGALLRHLTGILNASCTFPPCRRPAAQSDYEHSVPFEAGGRTCLCEAGPLCKR